MSKIVFYHINAEDKKFFEKNLKKSGHELVFETNSLNGDNASLAADADIISLFVSCDASKDNLQQMRNLKHIATRSTGYNHIDLEYAKSQNISVSNVPSYGENTVAEYTFMLILAMLRKIIPSVEQIKSGQIHHEAIAGYDLAQKTIGVIGTGKIGAHVIQIAAGFEMEILAYDPFPKPALAGKYNVRYVGLDDLFAKSDIITLHAPYTKENHHLLDAKAFGKMKSSTVVINTARGELIDTDALLEALKQQKNRRRRLRRIGRRRTFGY